MKKFWMLTLVLFVCVSMVGCGGGKKDKDTAGDKTTDLSGELSEASAEIGPLDNAEAEAFLQDFEKMVDEYVGVLKDKSLSEEEKEKKMKELEKKYQDFDKKSEEIAKDLSIEDKRKFGARMIAITSKLLEEAKQGVLGGLPEGI